MENEIDERTPQELGNIMWDAGYWNGQKLGAKKCQEVLERQAGEAYGARNDDLAKMLRSAADRLTPTIEDFAKRTIAKEDGEKEAAKALGNCLSIEQVVTLINSQIAHLENHGHDTDGLRDMRDYFEDLPGKTINWDLVTERIENFGGDLR